MAKSYMKIIRKIFDYLNDGQGDNVSFNVNNQIDPDVIQLALELEKLKTSNIRELIRHLSAGLDTAAGENIQYQSAEALTMAIYPKYKFSEFGRIFLEDKEFLHYYEKFMDLNNWHSLDRKYTLNELLKVCLHVEGDYAECGTYKGASAYLMCQESINNGRIIHLFDSFEGLSEPDSRDGAYWIKGALGSTENMLRETLEGYENYRVYKGWIPERFNDVSNHKFSFLHIDVDLYQPTLDSLIFFYERITSGGLILMDDYGFKSCPGAKQAADEFFLDKSENIIQLPTGQAFVMKQ